MLKAREVKSMILETEIERMEPSGHISGPRQGVEGWCEISRHTD